MGKLTTHVLDTANGCAAAGICFALYQQGRDTPLQQGVTNQNGRTDTPLLDGEAMQAGRYSLVFEVATYFRAKGVVLPDPPFLEEVRLDFGIADSSAHYHVPLLVSPWSYSTYRGS